MRRWLKLGASILVIAVAFFSSLSLVLRVDNNSASLDDARAAVLASCQNLNRKIDASQNPAAMRSTNFLIAEILEHATVAEREKYRLLVQEAAETQLRKTRCDRIVQRTFPE